MPVAAGELERVSPSAALPRNDAGEVVLARADFRGDGKIDGWQCTDCGVEFRSLYGILRHLAYGRDPRVVVEVLDGEITRKEE